MVDRETRAYLAGLFDGEGCVHLVTRSNRRASSRVRLTLAQKDPTILYWIQATLGYGQVYTSSGCPIWVVQRKKEARRFIQLILPFARIKRGQLEMALQMQDLIGEPGCKVTKANLHQRAELHSEFRRIYRKG